MNNRLYLVTGAAGFLGGHVCRQLIARGDKVRAFALPGDKAIKFILEGCQKVEDAVVGGFNKMADGFVEKHLLKEGETVEEARARFTKEQEERETQAKH